MDIDNIITTLNNRIENEEFKRKHRMSHLCFSHDCAITFSDTMQFVLTNNKSTLGIETLNHNVATNKNHHASAYSRARQKVKYEAFADLLQLTGEIIEPKEKYKGYQLKGVDGTEFQLPKTAKLSNYNNKNFSCPAAHLVCSYDVMNKIYLDAEIAPYPANERDLTSTILSRSKTDSKQIYLLDRGFPSVLLIKQFNDLGLNYVFRVSNTFLKEINDFTISDKEDETLTIEIDNKRASRIKLEQSYTFNIRCVKIVLKSGETEVLITNLSDEFTKDNLSELYWYRWGIETSFNHLKNSIMFERFFSLHENSIKQEVYASLIQYNLSTVITNLAEELLKKNENSGNKHTYKVNISNGIAFICASLRQLFISKLNNHNLINNLVKLIARFSNAVRKNRPSQPRNRVNPLFPNNYRRFKFHALS